MSMDSGLTFSRSPIRCHLYSTSTCGPTLPRHRRDIADRESNIQAFSVVENPDSPIPDSLGFLDTRPTRSTVLILSEISLLAISPLPLHQLGAPTRDMPICDVKCDLTVPETPDRRLYFLLSFEPLPPCAQTCNFPCKPSKHDLSIPFLDGLEDLSLLSFLTAPGSFERILCTHSLRQIFDNIQVLKL
jgi:hypothetical protein